VLQLFFTLNDGSSKQGNAFRAAIDSNCVDAITLVSLAASVQQQQQQQDCERHLEKGS
jgi:hypothetical protein